MTNVLEWINEECRRRPKEQAWLADESVLFLLLFALLCSGQISLRKLDGSEELTKRKAAGEKQAP